MSTLEAIILGIVQGLTEFLPVSSSGHLRIVPALFGWDDPGTAFTAVIQLGTMAAVVIYFWKDLWRITVAWLTSLRDPAKRSDPDARMGWYLIVATIPIGILGLLFKDQIESGARDLRLIAGTLIVMGLVLLYAEKVATRRKELDDVDTRDGVAIGLAQSLALVPGVSRSGSTISAGLFLGYTREAAARFSFLLSIPAVVLSGLFSLKDLGSNEGASVGALPTAIATAVSFGVGYLAIAWFLKYLTSHSTKVFVVYRVALGLLLIGLLLGNVIDAR
ncbi:undecaprenyl-diphosphate phosphatase [Aquihabitans sp. G128]|uniref:undecaprenyl-diphosphate phosphatase n=1 Tax=Aquihabitans sp. G128 TaxID=2849779 RepID=UPI001C24CB97|nr:undecaprenyl-diphosphate phosphatase [Aquihabitans sp. G128]QXC63266.1 undecaprenyl-diphosphate phosphatase [Aquihabitans sp. G128]